MWIKMLTKNSAIIVYSSASGCAAPSDSKGLKALLSPVSSWLQVVTP